VAVPEVVRFGTFELDLVSGELRSQGRRVPLQGQPAQVLALLVRHPGQVVTRDELRQAVWAADTFIEFDTALNVAVSKIRLALGDAAARPRFVETVPRHGYRFLADVHPVVPAGPAPLAGPRRRWLPWTAALAVALLASLAAGRLVRPQAPPPTHAAAQERYLRARYHTTRRTLADSRRAAELLEEAVRLDPRSAPAEAARSEAYLAIPWLGGPAEPAVARARQAALRALELDPQGPEAHAALGAVLVHFDWDPEGGERELQRALQLGPANTAVLRHYQLFLWQEGRFAEALALNERELALDPASAFAHRNRAIILYYARRYEECVEQCRRTLELDRYFATVYDWLGRAHEQLGRRQEALAAFVAPLTFQEVNRPAAEALRAAARQESPRGFWQRWLELELSGDDPHNDARALAYLRLGDRDRALEALERLVRERSPWVRTLKVEPLWDPLRGDARFQALLRRVNLDRPQPEAASSRR
jgi:DNA-binding winged helix-turn-helix (wHTH) protein/tetratricopeptide (TPR) repeat protein